jgi:hypothetical protein
MGEGISKSWSSTASTYTVLQGLQCIYPCQSRPQSWVGRILFCYLTESGGKFYREGGFFGRSYTPNFGSGQSPGDSISGIVGLHHNTQDRVSVYVPVLGLGDTAYTICS